MEGAEVKEGPKSKEKLRWYDLFERGSHRKYLEYLRDKQYEDIITTLRQGYREEDEVNSVPLFHIQIPAEQYFLTPDPTMLRCGYDRRLLSSSGTFSSSLSESSSGPSTVITSLPAPNRKCLRPEVMKEKKKRRRRRTVVCVCFGLLTLALVALGVGVVLHFLLETGNVPGPFLTDDNGINGHVTNRKPNSFVTSPKSNSDITSHNSTQGNHMLPPHIPEVSTQFQPTSVKSTELFVSADIISSTSSPEQTPGSNERVAIFTSTLTVTSDEFKSSIREQNTMPTKSYVPSLTGESSEPSKSFLNSTAEQWTFSDSHFSANRTTSTREKDTSASDVHNFTSSSDTIVETTTVDPTTQSLLSTSMITIITTMSDAISASLSSYFIAVDPFSTSSTVSDTSNTHTLHSSRDSGTPTTIRSTSTADTILHSSQKTDRGGDFSTPASTNKTSSFFPRLTEDLKTQRVREEKDTLGSQASSVPANSNVLDKKEKEFSNVFKAPSQQEAGLITSENVDQEAEGGTNSTVSARVPLLSTTVPAGGITKTPVSAQSTILIRARQTPFISLTAPITNTVAPAQTFTASTVSTTEASYAAYMTASMTVKNATTFEQQDSIKTTNFMDPVTTTSMSANALTTTKMFKTARASKVSPTLVATNEPTEMAAINTTRSISTSTKYNTTNTSFYNVTTSEKSDLVNMVQFSPISTKHTADSATQSNSTTASYIATSMAQNLSTVVKHIPPRSTQSTSASSQYVLSSTTQSPALSTKFTLTIIPQSLMTILKDDVHNTEQTLSTSRFSDVLHSTTNSLTTVKKPMPRSTAQSLSTTAKRIFTSTIENLTDTTMKQTTSSYPVPTKLIPTSASPDPAPGADRFSLSTSAPRSLPTSAIYRPSQTLPASTPSTAFSLIAGTMPNIRSSLLPFTGTMPNIRSSLLPFTDHVPKIHSSLLPFTDHMEENANNSLNPTSDSVQSFKDNVLITTQNSVAPRINKNLILTTPATELSTTESISITSKAIISSSDRDITTNTRPDRISSTQSVTLSTESTKSNTMNSLATMLNPRVTYASIVTTTPKPTTTTTITSTARTADAPTTTTAHVVRTIPTTQTITIRTTANTIASSTKNTTAATITTSTVKMTAYASTNFPTRTTSLIPATLPAVDLTGSVNNDSVFSLDLGPDGVEIIHLDNETLHYNVSHLTYYNETEFNRTRSEILKVMTSSWLGSRRTSPSPDMLDSFRTSSPLNESFGQTNDSFSSLFSELFGDVNETAVNTFPAAPTDSAAATNNNTSSGKAIKLNISNNWNERNRWGFLETVTFKQRHDQSGHVVKGTTLAPFFFRQGKAGLQPSSNLPITEKMTTSLPRQPRGPVIFGLEDNHPTTRRPRQKVVNDLDPFGFQFGKQEEQGGGKSDFSLLKNSPGGALRTTTTTITTTQTTTTEKPAEVIIIAPDVTAELGMSPTNNLKVTCHAFQAWGWTYMSLSRYEGTGHMADAVEFLGGVYIADEFPFIPIDSRMSHHRVHRDVDRVSLTLESQYAMCEDKGTYLCEIFVNGSMWSKDFNVDIMKKPDVPVLKIPSDIISGQEVTFTTTWKAGAPLMGSIVHKIVGGFTNLSKLIINETTVTKQQKCEFIVINSYSLRPDILWNGTEIEVSIIPNEDANSKMKETLNMLDKARVILSVLRNDICKGHKNMILPHPYTCRRYINCNFGAIHVEHCPENKCFHELQLSCY